jgi:hypothetical protein
MTTMADIYAGAFRLITELLRQEIDQQGHRLTGALEDSLDYDLKKEGRADVLEGTALYYSIFVNEGVPAASVSMKQFPFVVEYFKKRGLNEPEAKNAAAATIKTWMKTGMPSPASRRFSRTGGRTGYVLSAFTGGQPKIDQYMNDTLDFGVEEKFQLTKSETL